MPNIGQKLMMTPDAVTGTDSKPVAYVTGNAFNMLKRTITC